MISYISASLDDEGLETLRHYGEVRYLPLAETKQMLGGSRLVKALEGVDVFITEADNLRETRDRPARFLANHLLLPRQPGQYRCQSRYCQGYPGH